MLMYIISIKSYFTFFDRWWKKYLMFRWWYIIRYLHIGMNEIILFFFLFSSKPFYRGCGSEEINFLFSVQGHKDRRIYNEIRDSHPVHKKHKGRHESGFHLSSFFFLFSRELMILRWGRGSQRWQERRRERRRKEKGNGPEHLQVLD